MKELKSRSKYFEIGLACKEDGGNRVAPQPTTNFSEMSAADLSRSQLPSHTDDISAAVGQMVEL